MNDVSVCNKCKTEFIPDMSLLGEIQKDDLVVQYFTCPNCGEPPTISTICRYTSAETAGLEPAP